MKTSTIAKRSLMRGALVIFPIVAVTALLLPLRAEARVRVNAQIGPVEISYREGPHGAACRTFRGGMILEPVGRRVLASRWGYDNDRDRDDRDDRDDRRGEHRGRGYRGVETSGCREVVVNSCRACERSVWVPGHFEKRGGRHGRGHKVWVEGYWSRG